MNAPEAPVREGEVLAGKYRVERVLGVGGMGVVVAAMHTELEERVALKFLLPSAAQSPGVVARFAREARAVAKIKSEHVARVRDTGTMDSGIPYIVMEYLEGSDLSDMLLKRGQIPSAEAVDYVLQASEAIAEAHAVGIIHRDLKPANLFLARQTDGMHAIKVLDFGISKAVIGESEPASVKEGALTRTTDIFGSPMYMSPEQLKSSRDVDARADIWAMGVILYELITGKAPFDRATVAETFGAILYEEPPPLRATVASVPEALDRAVLRCIEKDKSKRFSNVAELAKALFPFAENATRQSLDRTSRVLRRAGVLVDSVPPPPASVSADSIVGAAVRGAAGGTAQTRTSWDSAAQTAKPRSGGRAPLIAGFSLAVLLSAGGFFALMRLRSPALPAKPEHPGAAPSAVLAAAPPPAPLVTAQATSASAPGSSLPVEPPVPSPAKPSPSVPQGKAAGRGPKAPGAAPPRAEDLPGPVVTPGTAAIATVAPAPPPPAPPPPPPAPAKPEPDDFGDRK
jgi:eukaryotic-like serine/threonine-protein kinase